VHVPDSPGLGIQTDTEAIRRYLVKVEIKAKDTILFSSDLQTL
jgi:hypothetical protein